MLGDYGGLHDVYLLARGHSRQYRKIMQTAQTETISYQDIKLVDSPRREPQEIFARINELKLELREKKRMLKEIYLQSPDYARAEEELTKHREKRKALQEAINLSEPQLIDSIDKLKVDLTSEKDIFNELMVVKVAKGERVELVDRFMQPCFPLFSVKMVPQD